MSKPRTIQEINNDYFQTAAMLGDLEWKMSKFPDQIEALKTKLRSIDKEADFAQKSQERDQKTKIDKAGEAKIKAQMPKTEEVTTEAQVQ